MIREFNGGEEFPAGGQTAGKKPLFIFGHGTRATIPGSTLTVRSRDLDAVARRRFRVGCLIGLAAIICEPAHA